MFLLRLIINALALLAVAYWVPGINVSGFYIALITAIILGILNAVIRPLLIILTLPITIVTLGLFTFVINAFIFWFVSSFVGGFEVHGFAAAFVGAMLMSFVSWIAGMTLKT